MGSEQGYQLGQEIGYHYGFLQFWVDMATHKLGPFAAEPSSALLEKERPKIAAQLQAMLADTEALLAKSGNDDNLSMAKFRIKIRELRLKVNKLLQICHMKQLPPLAKNVNIQPEELKVLSKVSGGQVEIDASILDF